MHGTTNAIRGRDWLFGATMTAISLVALAWVVMPSDRAVDVPHPATAIEITPPVPAARAAAPAETSMAPLPTVPTPQNGRVAEVQLLKVLHERRDESWAARSEAAIRKFLSGISYIGGQRYLTVKCAASACEVNGYADADPMTRSFQPVWQALERDTGGRELLAYGLERRAAVFDTGRSGDEFKIYYARKYLSARN